jgi:SAM-dependent methyltransferase
MTKNIKYQTKNISNYFSQNRVKWNQFYESEKIVIEEIGIKDTDQILDIGCGCGGLGLALKENFGVHDYTGVEINELAAQTAIQLNSEAKILCGDFLDLSKSLILNKEFDIVFSLSCFDWNVQFDEMLNSSWNHVKPGGALVATFRLTCDAGCDDMSKSYQYIDEKSGELAAYVVINAEVLLNKLKELSPTRIIAYGYFGTPSPTAVTPYTELCFAAFAIQKKKIPNLKKPELNLDLPQKILLLDL